MEYKILIGYLADGVAIVSYLIYFFGIWKGKTKPHAFTWFVWGVSNAVAFVTILISGGETGSGIFAVNAIGCFAIALVGLYQKHVEYDVTDWLSLFGALFGIVLWTITHNPLYAVILISVSDAVSMVPSLRKAYKFPYEENLAAFVLSFIYYPFGIFALGALTLTTWLYPVVIIVVDATLIVLIIFRRKKVQKF